MISSNDFRNGITIVIEGQLWTVIEFQHVKPGKGSAFVRTRLKNVKTGSTVERSFRAGEKLDAARVRRHVHAGLVEVRDRQLRDALRLRDFQVMAIDPRKLLLVEDAGAVADRVE